MIYLFLVLLPLAYSTQELSITEHIQKYGYRAETHHFVTADGYILGAQRIPYEKSKKVVLLVHGLGGNAENFILLGPTDAMAFYFADRGYDVWMFNARGTGHSRKHQTLNANWDRKKYWNFSWHELGIYDLPATINYILNQTGMDNLFYVSHSQGGTMFYVMLSEQPEMNEKIRAAALLAPSSFLSTTQSPIFKALTKLQPFLERTLELFNWYELPVPNGEALIRKVLYNFCKPPSMQDLCMDVVYFFGGPESGLINKTLLPIMLQYSPASLSGKQLSHYAQIIRNGGFKQYDHGVKTNMKLYNNKNPPSYNLSNVKVPLAYFYAPEDPYSNAKMAEEVFKYIPNIVLKYQVPVLGWNHLDYLLAYNAKMVINDKIEEVFQGFTKD